MLTIIVPKIFLLLFHILTIYIPDRFDDICLAIYLYKFIFLIKKIIFKHTQRKIKFCIYAYRRNKYCSWNIRQWKCVLNSSIHQQHGKEKKKSERKGVTKKKRKILVIWSWIRTNAYMHRCTRMHTKIVYGVKIFDERVSAGKIHGLRRGQERGEEYQKEEKEGIRWLWKSKRMRDEMVNVKKKKRVGKGLQKATITRSWMLAP